MTTLEQYLNEQKIEARRLSIEAGVRYVTVWNALKGKPIFAEHAQKIRVALLRLTGRAYAEPLPTLGEPSIDQFPTIPIRRLKGEQNEKGGFPSHEPL